MGVGCQAATRMLRNPFPRSFTGYSDPLYNLGILHFPPVFRAVLWEAVLVSCCNLLCDFRQFTLEILYLKKVKSERFHHSNNQSLIASKMSLSRVNFSREKQTLVHMDVSVCNEFFSHTWNFWTCSPPAPKFPKLSENSSPTPETFGSAAQKCHQQLTFPGKSRQFSTWSSLYAMNSSPILEACGPATLQPRNYRNLAWICEEMLCEEHKSLSFIVPFAFFL